MPTLSVDLWKADTKATHTGGKGVALLYDLTLKGGCAFSGQRAHGSAASWASHAWHGACGSERCQLIYRQSNGSRTLVVAVRSSIIIECSTLGTTWMRTPLALSKSVSGKSGVIVPVFPGNPCARRRRVVPTAMRESVPQSRPQDRRACGHCYERPSGRRRTGQPKESRARRCPRSQLWQSFSSFWGSPPRRMYLTRMQQSADWPRRRRASDYFANDEPGNEIRTQECHRDRNRAAHRISKEVDRLYACCVQHCRNCGGVFGQTEPEALGMAAET